MLETYITNLKKSYMKPFVIFLMIYIISLNGLALMGTQAWAKVPIIIYIVLAIWFVSCLVIIKQDSFNNIKVDEPSALRYLVVNVFVGYIQVVALSAGYVIWSAHTHWNVLSHWLEMQVAIFMSLLGLIIFSLNEFHIAVKSAKRWLNMIAILLKLGSFGILIYLNFTLPRAGDENLFIWTLVILIICIDALLVRSFFNYALYVRTLSGELKAPDIEASNEDELEKGEA
ncbi:DUF5079 family protein [Staphylococcus ratti]|uniref:DUF5079 family protein n=1 Tax=Staphylococcus ratti TaxID=2892440 RepID=A0ABY3PCH8_9STAP|nr:DUF5079 family protein [Staphylococcus ratti]UEX90015.1 DUF5079 family protein [Staphylococcus ratti]